jgi:outer membrane immunogenic protein
MKRLLFAGIAFAVVAAPAGAANLPVKAPLYKAPPPVVLAESWAGFYIGGDIGGTWLRASETFINNGGAIDPLSFSASSVVGGGHAGLQGQWGNFVLGIEGTFSVADLHQTVPSINPGAGRIRSLRVDDISTVVGKIGFSGGPWLLYAKGGWADLRVNTSSFSFVTGNSSNNTNWYGGWTVGAGLEYLFARSWMAGVEFDYYTAKFDHAFLFADGTGGLITNSRADVYAVVARLSYLFNWGPLVAK